MKEVSQKNFGLVVAYIVPGLVVLWGVSFYSNTVNLWLTNVDGAQPTVAGFLYVTLGSLAAGLTLGAIRSVTVDFLHHRTGVAAPELDFSDFQAKFWAFNQLVESHYRYYQFYAHMSLAVPGFVAARMLSHGSSADWREWVGCLLLEIILLSVSRETLRTYYSRASHLLGMEERGTQRRGRGGKPTRTKERADSSATEDPASSQLADAPEPRRVPRW